jgi:type IV secretion system protein VirB10
MKGKFVKEQQSQENEDQQDDALEVEAGGPSIASLKKNKVVIIAASSVLITIVLYFLFLKDEPKKEEALEEVKSVEASIGVAPAEKNSSPFEIEEKSKQNPEILAKPETPEVPALPELPAGLVSITQDLPIDPPKIDETKQANNQQNQQQSQQLLPTQQQNNSQQPQQQNQQQINGQNQDNKPPVEQKKDINPRYAPILVMGGNQPGPSLGVGYEKNIVNFKEDQIDKLEKSKIDIKTTYITDRANTISQGKILSAILETAINTEIPGFVRAIVSHDVYGESGFDVLIPRGSRLFGSYSSEVKRGQGRVEITWTRLIRSDGVDLSVSLKASDQFGRSGIGGDVDNRYGSIIANSLLTSILAVGTAAAADSLITGGNNQSSVTMSPTIGATTTTGNASSQAIYQVSKTIIDTVGRVINNAIDTNPVIRVPQGTKITVIVNADMKIPSMRSVINE